MEDSETQVKTLSLTAKPCDLAGLNLSKSINFYSFRNHVKTYVFNRCSFDDSSDLFYKLGGANRTGKYLFRNVFFN